MKNLVKLRGNPNYEGISVTKDYTLLERSVIKKWTQKAKERNLKDASDSNIIWRVRGSPASGLYLKKTEKKRKVLQNKQL